MNPNQIKFFEQKYESMETEELIELHRKKSLLPEAESILLRVLENRGISDLKREEITEELRKTSYDEKMKRFAPIGSRFGARFLDSFFTLLAMIVMLAIIKSLSMDIVFVFIALLICLGYALLADSLPHGQSLGKRMNGIAVISKSTGKPCSIFQSFVRNVFVLTLGIIDVALMLSDSRQRIGDRVAGTEVVTVEYLNTQTKDN